MGIGCNIKLNVGKLAKDIRAWLFLSVIGIGAMFRVFGFTELPKRVEKVEVKTEKNESSVDKLANTVDDYITGQKIRAEEQQKRDVQKETSDNEYKMMMNKWIEAVSKK